MVISRALGQLDLAQSANGTLVVLDVGKSRLQYIRLPWAHESRKDGALRVIVWLYFDKRFHFQDAVGSSSPAHPRTAPYPQRQRSPWKIFDEHRGQRRELHNLAFDEIVLEGARETTIHEFCRVVDLGSEAEHLATVSSHHSAFMNHDGSLKRRS